MIKKCSEHANRKTCIQVIAEGNCIGKNCRLFKKVLNILPKLKKMYELLSLGVEPTTIWDFSEKAMERRRKRKIKADKWLNEYYPRIIKGLQKMGVEETT